MFDEPLALHHKLVGRWVASREASAQTYTRAGARQYIERVFNAAVLDILDPIELADLRIAVVHSEEEAPPAIVIVCASLGQVDLGWIETSEAPIPWRAAAYNVLERSLGKVFPVVCYDELFEQISGYYWDGEITDEGAREALVDYHGVNPNDLGEHTLPSTMNARRPQWMLAENAAEADALPTNLRRKLDRLDETLKAFNALQPERNAWHLDFDTAYQYLFGIDECSSMPPMTLVPFDQFAGELDDVMRHGMEYGFMDALGIYPLPGSAPIEDWFASLRAGAQFLAAVQDLLQLDPTSL